ncbi:Zinc-type alcohol dehydrogenase-like protein [Cyphellophora attinorum]|uniref:Zinc-type alcohol dehydrogenase-like protein n=1 Tax=Cyphellophora attinorum TaxID=1664694 RepID=A0A0N1HAX1_9EURO|nr:Zinc-type alcohol dehydrogenase-like protein [Phialophora attinorum]KPI40046.1 Zinc-type alcohol dehydrogenase-like protein [Phialophora attinorum]
MRTQIPPTMKQWVTDYTGIDTLKQEEAPVPKPGAGEVLVRISAVSLNFRDVEVCMGDYDHHDSLPPPPNVVPCSDFLNISGRRPGNGNIQPNASDGSDHRRASAFGAWSAPSSVLSEYATFPLYGLVKAPANLSDEEGSTLPIAAATAWMAINWMQPIGQPLRGAEHIVLLQGTGGVSTAGLQLAHALGLKTIVTSSSGDKLKKAKELGADYLVNYREKTEWQEEVMKLTDGKGVDVIFEQGGPATLAKSFGCVRWGGLISCIGYLSGKQDVGDKIVNTNVLALRRNVTLKGIWNGPKDRLEEAVAVYDKHRIKPVIDKTFAFNEAREAFKYVAAGSHFGKVIVKV